MCDEPFICARCAAQGPTCCRMDIANSNACFPLSQAEKIRLEPYAAALGVPAAGVEENTPEFLRLMRVLFQDRREVLDRAFPLGGSHWRLPLENDGACSFLREDGCALPRDARPWYCQLFPLWVMGTAFDRFQPTFCLVTREAPRLRDVFTTLNMTPEQAKNLYISLCCDWGVEK